MNITDAVEEKISGDKLSAIFNRQKELMKKYHDIELRSGLMQTEDCPINLNDKYGQSRIKDFCWRIIEEVGESLDAFQQNDFVHVNEELIDGLHFLVEMTILTGKDETFLYSEQMAYHKDKLYDFYLLCKIGLPVDTCVSRLVENLGMMANCFKNKPWKQSNMLTDIDGFYDRLYIVWVCYFNLLSVFLDADEICEVYFKKSQVNKFRQRSNY